MKFSQSENNDINVAKSVVESAIKGMNDLLLYLGDDFLKLIEAIYNLKGHVIVSGMGKSGHIARKISSTLASTGTSSFFIHPAEASHGDLGRITKNDLVILLSNSGETKELSDIINYTKRFNIPLVCIVRKEKSSLVSASNIKIILPAADEALLIDAPTTSSTMMLVFGDALAITLLEKKGFTREDFHIFHPGGRLGASFIKIKDVMHIKDAVPIAHKDTLMYKVVDIMTDKKFGCIAIIDDHEKLIGVITDGCLRRNIDKNILNLTASEVMTLNPFAIKQDSLVIEALDFMNEKSITTLFVLDEESSKVFGIIHMHDCLRAGASPSIK